MINISFYRFSLRLRLSTIVSMTTMCVPAPVTELTPARLSALGEAIERCGITADPVALLLLAHEASDRGVDPILVDVMVDEDEPAVARVRAFARVSSALLREPALVA